RGDAGVTWVANYAARRVVRIDADGRQSVALASDRKFRPVGVFKHGQRLFVLEHGSDGIRVRVKDLRTGQVNHVVYLSD
ncbi:MAG: hypothetical protein AAF270_16285, partial [Pseudomonadota bacterium]